MRTICLNRIDIPNRLYFKAEEAIEVLGIKPYILSSWETEFAMIQPEKSSSGQKVYRKQDVEILATIKQFLFEDQLSVEVVQQKLREMERGAVFPFAEEREAAHTHTSSGLVSTPTFKGLEELHQIAEELKNLSQMPLDKFFKF